jgi:hypothetical protein
VRPILAACLALVLTGVVTPSVVLAVAPRPSHSAAPNAQEGEGRRTVLGDVPEDIIPQTSNIWQCACDNDGCWPGCFTVASATILKYWSTHGFPSLWDGNEGATLERLRNLFPNLFCYNNVDDDGLPSDSGYEANDVSKGLDLFIQERGHKFRVRPIARPTFEQIVAEIDAGRPLVGAFGLSPWGSHAGTIIGYDTTGGRQVMIVRPNLWQKPDTELVWGKGYGEFGVVTVAPADGESAEIPKLALEVVVNDTDTGFVMQGDWRLKLFGFGGDSRFAETTDPSNLGPTDDTAVARWTPNLPFDGLWEVRVWIPRQDTDDSAAMVATYHVNHAEGMTLIRRSQNKARPGWLTLGAYPFVRGEKGMLQLGNRSGDNPPRTVWADAAKFVWRGPLVAQSEEGGPLWLIDGGQRHLIPDEQTFDALRLKPVFVRKLTPMALDQYPVADMLPSVMSTWIGQYFDNALLSEPAAQVRADSALNFRWNGAAPSAAITGPEYSARWTRYLALSEGEHAFRVEAVGGVRMWVDGKLEINEWDARSDILLSHEKPVQLASGLHRVDIEFLARSSYAQISFGNLPPNTPVPADPPELGWSRTPTATLRWTDAGDPDNFGTDQPRRYFATAWNEQNGWRASSGWITETEWILTLPSDGRYLWNVVASDGTANSNGSPTREILVDRSAPWAQMADATPAQSAASIAALAVASSSPIDAYRLVTDANGNMTVEAVAPAELIAEQAGAATAAATAPLIPRGEAPQGMNLGNLPAVHLRWWAKDEPRPSTEGLTYEVQAREVVRAQTSYTVTTEMHEVTRVAYELTISGTQEITTPVVLTDVVPYTTVVPLVESAVVTEPQWITIATGLPITETVFIGTPGSAYEFRVRAIDSAGNAQEWYEGYSVRAEIDPKAIVYRGFLPTVNR